MMGEESSTSKCVDAPTPPSPPPPPPPPPLESNNTSQYTAALSSYEAACKDDPGLQSFDVAQQERTSRVINSLATPIEAARSLSLDTIKVIADCLLEMNQEVVNLILECKKEIWNNQDMFPLVEDYFKNTTKTLEFCTDLENCLKSVLKSQEIIKAAVNGFEGEVEAGVEGKGCVKTLQALRSFKKAEDPFKGEFSRLFESVYIQQADTFEKLKLQKRKLDKKLKSVKAWRRLSNVIFVVAFVSVLIFTVVAAAISAPPLVTALAAALAAALAVPIGSVRKWCGSLCNRYEKAFKGQREIICSMQVGTFITIKDMDNIRVLVGKLEMEIESLLQNADFALRVQEEAVKLVMDEIKKKLEMFMETIENLGRHADECGLNLRTARTMISRRIIGYARE